MNPHRLIALVACAFLAAGAAQAHTDPKTTTVLAPRTAAPVATTSPAVSAMKAIMPPALPVSVLQPGTWALTLKNSQGQVVTTLPLRIDAAGADGRQQMTYCPGNFTFGLSYLTADLSQGTVSGSLTGKGHGRPAGQGDPMHTMPGQVSQFDLQGTVSPSTADARTYKTVSGQTHYNYDITSFTLVPIDVTGLGYNAAAPQTECSWQGDVIDGAS